MTTITNRSDLFRLVCDNLDLQQQRTSNPLISELLTIADAGWTKFLQILTTIRNNKNSVSPLVAQLLGNVLDIATEIDGKGQQGGKNKKKKTKYSPTTKRTTLSGYSRSRVVYEKKNEKPQCRTALKSALKSHSAATHKKNIKTSKIAIHRSDSLYETIMHHDIYQIYFLNINNASKIYSFRSSFCSHTFFQDAHDNCANYGILRHFTVYDLAMDKSWYRGQTCFTKGSNPQRLCIASCHPILKRQMSWNTS